MSMLAEKRQKSHWVLDPRQNEWTKDSNKFGQRMLEKMGWTPGKGLGAKEQGMTEALRVKYKSDSKGLGCTDPKFEWLKQQEEFDKLLSTLNSNAEDISEPKQKVSLEEKSKLTKKRVFYHKSIKGKDVMKYSEHDLKCIIGFGNGVKDDNFDIKNEIETEHDIIQNKIKKFQENEEDCVVKTKKKKKKKIALDVKPEEATQDQEIEFEPKEEINKNNGNTEHKKKKKKKKRKNLLEEDVMDDTEVVIKKKKKSKNGSL